MQKKSREELPPVISTDTLTVEVANIIYKLPKRSSKNYAGYDYVEFKATKFNNVPRYFGIPHPKAHIDLAFEIANSWKLICKLTNTENSFIKPECHGDGRVIVMDYEATYQRTIRHLDASFNCHFYVKTDISSCFPSLYTHAIPWALVGFERAKKKKGVKWKRKWFNRLDEAARWQKRNETQGVLIGPANSNVLAEIVISQVDKQIAKDFHFERYIDDYACYAKSYDEAEEFVRKLSQELKKYNLLLSPSKTYIKQLPIALNDDWANQLNAVLPKDEEPTLGQLVSYLDKAMQIQKEHLEGSVIKYAAKTIVNKAVGLRRMGVVKYLLGLSLHYPVLIPVYSDLLKSIYDEYGVDYVRELLDLLDDRILNRCSDGVCWLLYYLNRVSHTLSAQYAEKIIKSEDCMSLSLLAADKTHRPEVVKFAKKLNKGDLYLLDRFWILLYQLFKTDEIANPYNSDDTFKVLKDNKVSFIAGWT